MKKTLKTDEFEEVANSMDGGSISMNGDFMNSKIYVYGDGTIETIFYAPGWKKTRKQVNKKTARGKSFDYERNRGKTIIKAKTNVRRLIKHYKLRYLFVLDVGDESLTIKEADSKVHYFRNNLKANFPIFKTWITTRFYNQSNQLCYKIITDIFLSPLVLQNNWEHGHVSVKRCKGSEEIIAFNFTVDFNDIRFQSYKLYSPASGMKVPCEEFYSTDSAEQENYISENYPNLRKSYEKKHCGGLLKINYYKQG